MTAPISHSRRWRYPDDDRAAEIRAQFLRRTTWWDGGASRHVALALVYRQLNYSHSGVAKRAGVDEAAVPVYMTEVVDAHEESGIKTSLLSALAEWPVRPLSEDMRDAGSGVT